MARNSWDKRRQESKEAYSWFLIYRNLGPARSVPRAYAVYTGAAAKGSERQEPSGAWTQACSAHNWTERAVDWDIANLVKTGEVAIAGFVGLLHEATGRTLRALSNKVAAPKSWAEILQALTTLGQFFPDEALARVQNRVAARLDRP
jgi:hypothetical protein